MPLAHICPACGSQLARIRAVPDPVYILPLVLCTCGYASVRRRHPIHTHTQRALAACRAIIFLLAQLFLALVLSGAIGGFTLALRRSIDDLSLTPLSFAVQLFSPGSRSRTLQSLIDYDAGLIFIIGFAFVSFAAGIWLRAALAHWRWPSPIFAWIALASAWVWLETLVWPLTWLHGFLSGHSVGYSGLDAADSLQCLQILAASLLVSIVATPIGRGLSKVLQHSRRRRVIKYLNRRRRTRRGE